jgi:hypothetical protein
MANPRKENKINELQNEFDRIQQEQEIDVSKYLAKRDDLPDLGEIEIYDYDKDITESIDQASSL